MRISPADTFEGMLPAGSGMTRRKSRTGCPIQATFTRCSAFLNSGYPVTMLAFWAIADASAKQSTGDMLRSALCSA